MHCYKGYTETLLIILVCFILVVRSWKRMKKQPDELKRNENLSQMGFSLDFGRKEVSTVY